MHPLYALAAASEEWMSPWQSLDSTANVLPAQAQGPCHPAYCGELEAHSWPSPWAPSWEMQQGSDEL
eukprot:8526510-Heterocapsa_arctica.AAC.1